MNSFRLYQRLLRYARPYWPAFLIAALAIFAFAATETALPALVKPLFDRGFTTHSDFPVWWVPVAVVLIFVFRGIAGFISAYAMSWVSNNVLRDLRQAMYDKLLLMPALTYDGRTPGQLISRVITEVNGVTVAATNVVNTIVRDSLILIGLLAWLFWVNWILTLIILFLAPALISVSLIMSRRMRKVSRAAIRATTELTQSVEETVSSHKLVKLFQSHEFEQRRFGEINRRYRNQGMKVVITQALQAPLSQLIVACGIAVVLTIALLQARNGYSTIGDFVSFLTGMLMLLSPIKHLADVNAQLQRGLASAESIFEIIDEKSELDQGQRVLRETRGALAFRDVHLSYSASRSPALRGVTLSVEAGETVALVGPSGGGKTSLISLIPRLYDPTEGVILLDGMDTRDFTLQSLRSQISVVTQDPALINDTLIKNIAYGQKTIDIKRIERALAIADLDDFIEQLPEGLQTNVGSRGSKLSGGQKQRLAIARAAYRDSPVLILDEATSALDQITEKRVQDALEKLRQGRTTIIIAHRLSTIASVSRIVVLDQGRVIADGHHETLLKNCSLYHQIVNQMRPNHFLKDSIN